MTTIQHRLILCCAVLGFVSTSLWASAQEQPWNACKDQADKAACMHAQMEKHVAEHETRLHDALKLTAAQESAWTSFTESMHQQRSAMMAEHQGPPPAPSRADMEKIPAPDLLEHHVTQMQKHLATLQAHLAALKTFYAVLTPDQQTVMNKEVRQFSHRQHEHCFHHDERDHGQPPGN